MSALATQLKKQKLIGKPRATKKPGYYVIQLGGEGDKGHSAILYSAGGKVLNSINGDPNDSGAVVERAARNAWPGVVRKELRGPVRSRVKGFGDPELLDFKIKTGITRIFDDGEKLIVRKVRLDSGGYAPDHGKQYYGVNRPGQILFQIDGSTTAESLMVRGPSKPVIVGMLKALGYRAVSSGSSA